MWIIWLLLAMIAAWLIGYGALLAVSMRTGPVPDLSRPDRLKGTRWGPYAPFLEKGIAAIRALPWQDVWCTSFDGLRLHGRYLPGATGRLVLMAHGYRSSGENDLCGIVEYYRRRGDALLLIDQRGHGQSQGARLTFGVKEHRDMAAWVSFAAENHREALWLHGVSMGGVSMLMALPDCADKVTAAVADSPYDNIPELLGYQSHKRHRMPAWLTPVTLAVEGPILMGPGVMHLSAAGAAAASGLPVLVIHGDGDRTVPPGMPKRFAGASPRIRSLVIPGGWHAMCFGADPAAYEKALDDFTRQVEDGQTQQA